MFEKTFEAQALDASSAHLSPFSIAVGLHAAVAVVALGISFLIVPGVQVPDPPDPQPVFVFTLPLELVKEEPAPVAPQPPKKGSENPGAAAVPPKETKPPDTPPLETPQELPAPVEEIGSEGDDSGTKGDPLGSENGVEDSLGTGPGGPGGPGTGAGTNAPVELTPEMIPPVLLHKVSPIYPDVPRKARLQGRVTVQAVIGLDGSVESVEILRTTNPLFDDAALAAVKLWRYRAATMNGVPVRVFFTVEVGFVLR